MNIVICLDDRNGMMFNKRRLSSDKAVCQRIADYAEGKLFMSGYSAKLFEQYPVCVDEDFLEKAGEGDTCFAETPDFMEVEDKIRSITVYRWNRTYPSDKRLPAEFLSRWRLQQTFDFPGNSHDVVTEELYTR